MSPDHLVQRRWIRIEILDELGDANAKPDPQTPDLDVGLAIAHGAMSDPTAGLSRAVLRTTCKGGASSDLTLLNLAPP